MGDAFPVPFILSCHNAPAPPLTLKLQVTFFFSIISGALAREARAAEYHWVRKCGKLPIGEKLVIT